MKTETISFQEFANQVERLASGRLDSCSYRNETSTYHCMVDGYGEYKSKTPEIALAKLKKAINNK